MHQLWIRIPGHPLHVLGEQKKVLNFGRAATNDIVLEDPSISRSHARLCWRDGKAWLEDLGSRNGSHLNGVQIQNPTPVSPGDEILLGKVRVELETRAQQPALIIDAVDPSSQVSLILSVAGLGMGKGESTGSRETLRLRQALQIVQDMALKLLSEETPEFMLQDLLNRLFSFLRPGRGAVLLADAQGSLNQVAFHAESRYRGSSAIQISRTMVEAALERKEAMLVNNPLEDARLAKSASLLRSGTTSIMTVPLEHENLVLGLFYFDAGMTRAPFSEEDLRFVAALGHLAAAKLHNARLRKEVEEKKAMEKEMELARKIQEKLLPGSDPDIPGWDIRGHNLSCLQVSGDLYGFWPRQDGRLWLAIADVSGKGIGPGLLMASFQAYMQAWAELEDSPASLAARISNTLVPNTHGNRYITAILALLDPFTGELKLTNAGHNPGLLVRAQASMEELPSHGLPLALMAGNSYQEVLLTLNSGDLCFLYTDGITEATGPQELEFGLQGLVELLEQVRGCPVSEIQHRLQEALDRHTQGTPLMDDQTVLILQRR